MQSVDRLAVLTQYNYCNANSFNKTQTKLLVRVFYLRIYTNKLFVFCIQKSDP